MVGPVSQLPELPSPSSSGGLEKEGGAVLQHPCGEQGIGAEGMDPVHSSTASLQGCLAATCRKVRLDIQPSPPCVASRACQSCCSFKTPVSVLDAIQHCVSLLYTFILQTQNAR